MLPQAADARTRPRIGRYLITGRIGRGGMGMVYRPQASEAYRAAADAKDATLIDNDGPAVAALAARRAAP